VAFSFLKFPGNRKIPFRYTFLSKKRGQEIGKSFMKHFNSIKKSRDFQEVYQTGRSLANRLLVMYVRKTDRPETRIGISVSRKVGNSVVRHRITRLIRESFRLHEEMVEAGLDIVVVVRAAAKEENYKTIESAYLHLCGLHNILKKESK
jgi:ribonuclease P protein component